MKKHPIGIFISCKRDMDLEGEIQKAVDMGMASCQLSIWDASLFRDEAFAEYVKRCFDRSDFRISALWAGWTKPCEWNFTAGPATIGLVPPAYRFQRLQELLSASDFAEKIGVQDMITHVGFIPENPDDPNFSGVVSALRHLAKYMQKKGQYFLFETGQETPVTMLRTIEAIGTDNLGINFDTANLILYGKANSVDALDVFGKYVRNTHIKDGFYPTDGMNLGKMVPIGQGKANIPAVIRRLDEIGYEGPFTIESEIKGDRVEDIKNAKSLLESIMNEG